MSGTPPEVPAATGNQTTIEKANRNANDSTKDSAFYITLGLAVALVVGFGLLIYLLNGSASSDTEIAWQRRVYLFAGAEAVVFTAVGWLFGREVNRQQVEKADERVDKATEQADQADQRAAQATELSSDAKARVADLEARADATKAAVLARAATSADGKQRTKSIYGDSGPDTSRSEFDDLAAFLQALYPARDGTTGATRGE